MYDEMYHIYVYRSHEGTALELHFATKEAAEDTFSKLDKWLRSAKVSDERYSLVDTWGCQISLLHRDVSHILMADQAKLAEMRHHFQMMQARATAKFQMEAAEDAVLKHAASSTGKQVIVVQPPTGGPHA